MFRRKIFTARLIFAFLLSALFASSAASIGAQEPAASEKAALIRELVELIDARANAKAIMNSVVSQIQRDRQRTFAQLTENMDFLSEKEREDLIRKQADDSNHLSERVLQLFKEKLDLEKVVEDVSYDLFDKYYTADEVRDLIAFYKSPTGQKSIKLMPQIFADSMSKTSERLLPQIEPIMRQIVEEERQRIEKMLPPQPPPRRIRRRRGAAT
jgi:hypothetical protein